MSARGGRLYIVILSNSKRIRKGNWLARQLLHRADVPQSSLGDLRFGKLGKDSSLRSE